MSATPPQTRPLSPDDPPVRLALEHVSGGLLRIVARIEENDRRAAAAETERPDHPPPKRKKRPAPRPEDADPATSVSTAATTGPYTEGSNRA